MPRGRGIRGLRQEKQRQAALAAKGSEIEEATIAQMSEQMDIFKKNLEKFATAYKKQIPKNPEFRRDFQRMCTQIGVDPLASKKGFWTELLGIGDFYYELGVQIVEVCLITRPRNGGLISLEELKARVMKRRGEQSQDISDDDLERAIKKLKVLGSGFKLLYTGKRRMVQAVPTELNVDHTSVLDAAENTGFVTQTQIKNKMSWTDDRITKTLEELLKEGLAWVDDQAVERQYWFPGLIRSTV